MERFNVHAAQFAYDEDPDGYRVGMARFGPQIGMARLGGSVYELPPGQSVCPYHWEAGDEELLLVLAGEATVRHPQGEDVLGPGEVVCFREGPEGAHKVSNKSDETVRVLMLSTLREPALTVYPDSDKVGAFDKPSATRLLFRRGDAVDYFDGETA
ncbi:MAG: cupin domain-containing protein [Solirubrobacteraceae bacterium]|jgi:uncharacterized cupin superfamily protein